MSGDELKCVKCKEPMETEPPDYAQGLCHPCWYVSDLPEAKRTRLEDWWNTEDDYYPDMEVE